MSQSKITIVGKLRFTEEKGLEHSICFGKPEKEFWLVVEPEGAEAIRMSVGKYPEPPEKKPQPSFIHNREAFRQWSSAKAAAEEESETCLCGIQSETLCRSNVQAGADGTIRASAPRAAGDTSFYGR